MTDFSTLFLFVELWLTVILPAIGLPLLLKLGVPFIVKLLKKSLSTENDEDALAKIEDISYHRM